MGVSDTGIRGGREFPSTAWSVIRHLKDPSSPQYQEQLRRLIAQYWRPVYWLIRHAWKKSHDDAKDMVQEFFAEP